MTSPRIVRSRAELQTYLREERRMGNSVGFVPTMGALHEGHAALLRKASVENKVTVLSIFVNPKQFGPKEDLAKYPRTFEADLKIAAESGVACIFYPSVEDMYPKDFRTEVKVKELGEVLCGAFRPGHFDGVTTVVLLLLNLVMADNAYFGMKDFQQLTILRRMALDLAHPTCIIAVPTVREGDGLAMSSRNRYLDARGRDVARAVPQSLAAAAKLFLAGETSAKALCAAARRVLSDAGLEPQYLELRSTSTLSEVVTVDEDAVLAVAQFVETPTTPCRLIDNVVFSKEAELQQILRDLISRSK